MGKRRRRRARSGDLPRRPTRWRYTSPHGHRLTVQRVAGGGLIVEVPAPPVVRSVWPQLPELPADLEARVRAVTVRQLTQGRVRI